MYNCVNNMLFRFTSKVYFFTFSCFIFKTVKNFLSVILNIKNYTCHLTIPFRKYSYIYVNPNSSIISVGVLYYRFSMSYYYKHLNFIYSNLSRPSFCLLYYIGKGYKFYKDSNNTLTFQLGFSHMYYLYTSKASITFKFKKHIFLFGFDKGSLFNEGKLISSVKYANIFTQRGVRFKTAFFYKKKGKIASY